MAPAVKKSGANTRLLIGTLEAKVGLFGTNAKPSGLPKGWVTAGPSGGELKYEMRAAPAPVAEQGVEVAPVEPGASDPLATGEIPAGLAEEFIEATSASQASQAAIEEYHATPDANGALVAGQFEQVLVEAGTGEVVEHDDVRRGIRLDDGRFIDCTDQLAAIEMRTKLDRIEVVKCIDSTRIRRQRVLGARYVGGQDPESIAKLRLLYEGLKRRREVAVVKYTLRSRQYLGVIEADGRAGVLVLLDLVWSEDWRDVPAKAAAIAKVAVPEAQIDAMADLLGALHGTVDVLDELRDDAIALREELLALAQAGEMGDVVEPLPADEPEVALEEALAASLAAVKGGKV